MQKVIKPYPKQRSVWPALYYNIWFILQHLELHYNICGYTTTF